MFYIKGNKIVLADEAPFTDGSLRMYYYLKPNKLVEENRAATIVAINRSTGDITLNNVPDGFSSLPLMDYVQVNSPNLIIARDITANSIDSNTKVINFNLEDIPEELIVGDYINFASETIVPQLPTELHAILAQRVAVAALEALGDTEGKSNAEVRLEKMEKSTLSIIDNRVESATEKVRNKTSTLQETSYTRRGKF